MYVFVKVKEETEKAGLKLNIQKTKIMASRPITSQQIDGETMERVTDFIFLGFPDSSVGKEPASSAGDVRDVGLMPGSARKVPLEKGMATHSSILAWRIL